jgi:hypothetical protein
MRVAALGIASVILLAACASGPAPIGSLRFQVDEPVWRVNDREPLPAPPQEREYNRALYHTDGFVVRRVTRAMEVRPKLRAADVNSLDEVPDSTWFTNRIGVRELSEDELRAGPNRTPGPFDQLPWTITRGKSGGTAVGFVFEDATGAAFLLKFDEPDRPEMETAAHIIVHRILWACGYNVPEDYVGYVRRDELLLSAKATRKDDTGTKVPLTTEDLDRALARVAREPDGRIRVLASRMLPGKPIGPYAREGTRPDDPNDRIPHERRRSLRGQFSIFSWLNHTDMQEDNTLDMFQDGHVVHYLIDFGKALGVMGQGMRWQTVGYTYRLDVGIALRTLLGLGLWERPWEAVDAPPLRGVGLFEAKHYDPGAWRPNSLYWPYEDKDRFDAFWGAKLIMRFSRAQLAAIVDEAQLTDPRAAAYLVDTLVARQRTTARYWFERVAPLDRFAMDGARLCFDDLLLAYRLDEPVTRYEVEIYDRAGKPAAAPFYLAPGAGGRTCTAALRTGRDASAYTIVRLRVLRGDEPMPDVRVHLARVDGALSVIGLRRE